MAVSEPSFFARFGLAFACFFRVLLDARYAGSVQQIGREPALPAGDEQDTQRSAQKAKRANKSAKSSSATNKSAKKSKAPKKHDKKSKGRQSDKPPASTGSKEGSTGKEEQPAIDPAAEQVAGALVLLGVLQREGRLIDFLEQDIDAFDDEDVGAAARQVHEGCRQALRGHGQVEALHQQEEDSRVTVQADYDAAAYKLSGKVGGAGPYQGKLVHRGWRVRALSLPQLMKDADATVVAPAEVEVS